MFDHVWSSYNLRHMMDDLRICAALINKYFPRIISDKGNEVVIANRINEMAVKDNELFKIVDSLIFQKEVKKFVQFDNKLFPKLSADDLYKIACGSYQINLAPSYYSEHIKSSDSDRFDAYICPQLVLRNRCNQFFTMTNEPHLILVKMKSRHVSRKHYYTYILFDNLSCGINSIMGYSCDCKIGSRVVGACAHIMCVIWFLGYAQYRTIKEPSAFLNNYLIK